MLKDYECSKCGEITEYKKQYKLEFPEEITCIVCGSVMRKRMKKGSLGSVIIPEHMKSALGFKY